MIANHAYQNFFHVFLSCVLLGESKDWWYSFPSLLCCAPQVNSKSGLWPEPFRIPLCGLVHGKELGQNSELPRDDIFGELFRLYTLVQEEAMESQLSTVGKGVGRPLTIHCPWLYLMWLSSYVKSHMAAYSPVFLQLAPQTIILKGKLLFPMPCSPVFHCI